MQATLFEFRHRWWVIFFLFFAAFSAYSFDRANCGVAIADWLARRWGATAGANGYRVVFAAGALLVALAAWLRTWGTAYLRAEVMRDSQVHAERLLADGPYRHVRNPLYLGNILLAAGIGLMASRIGFLVLSLGMTIFVVRLILREEAELVRGQGEAYRRYCAAVPRLAPSLVPRVPAGGNRPRWGQAVAAESMYWLLSGSLAAFAITLRIKVFWGVFAAAAAASWLLKRAWTKRNQPAAPE
ncbi:MAG TPA: isoprenylcysteine carboxylmethyltransferase family protein [Candidatus Acidoferrales bacterium]|nr:isoprenylcysteine carboxylmethyltransferase family protein [Candidatus Acidoferrales bacterium]